MLGFLLFEKIFYNYANISRNYLGMLLEFSRNYLEFGEIFAKINDFFSREILNNFVKISCLNFLKDRTLQSKIIFEFPPGLNIASKIIFEFPPGSNIVK